MPIIPEEDNKLEISSAPPAATFEQKQRQRMLIALGVLLLALIVVLIRDRQFMAPPASTATPTASEPLNPPAVSQEASQTATPAVPSAPAPQRKSPSTVKNSKGRTPAASAPAAATAQDTNAPVITATNRTVLPPLEVEVVAGNQHRTLPATSNSVKVEMEPNSAPESPAPAQATEPAAPAPAPRVTLSASTAERVSRSVEPDYPLLAKQMKVQGAVVLQVLIDKSGNIEELHVVSGPEILAAAAQQALKQWRFKPYYQDGQPVETEARVTVNFTISTY